MVKGQNVPEETQLHETSTSLVKTALAELDAGSEMALMVNVSCPSACDLRGKIVKIITQDAAVAKEIELVSFDEAANETDEFVVKAPVKPGAYTWSAASAAPRRAQEQEGISHEASSAPFSFVVKPHMTSMAVWDEPSPIVLNTTFRLKVGINCSATDAHSNTATGSFTVTVVDTTAPSISGIPSNQTLEAASAAGAVATWTAPTASDLVDGSRPVTCTPASGSTFALGTTTVECSTTDVAGNTATGSFTVTVVDTTAPSISGIPSDQTLEATSAAGAVATWTAPTASDLVDGSRPVTCTPASGSTFALGTTTVNCSATDAHSNTATGSFTVTVTYAWSNFLQPINLNDSSIFKLGSTVPVKFQLTGASAGIPNAVAKFWYAKVSNNVAGSETEAVSTAASTTGNLFRYDSTAGQYVFNWSTKGLSGGAGTYEIRADLGDGVSHTVRISLKP